MSGPDERTPGEAHQQGVEDRDRTMISATGPVSGSAKVVATLVVVRGAEIGRHYPLRRSRVVLGRADSADVMIPDREMSRAHAAIDGVRMGHDTIYRLTDLGSTNHLYVNGLRTETRVLLNGDKIQVGETVLKFELHDAIDARFHTEIRNRIAYDDLSGLLTYESFRTALSWELERYANLATGCALVMMDLDDFKQVNDTHGHLTGSHVIHTVGGLIRTRLRQFDVAARYGGEEFVAYLPETAAGEALTAADRLRTIIGETVMEYQGRSLNVRISMGVSHFPQDGREIEPLIQVADERLYRAKREGKDRVCGR